LNSEIDDVKYAGDTDVMIEVPLLINEELMLEALVFVAWVAIG
jgi:hypothetical protein